MTPTSSVDVRLRDANVTAPVLASPDRPRFISLVDALDWRAAKTPDAPAFYSRVGSGWVPLSWHAFRERSMQLARAWILAGIGPGDRVAILAANSVEWELAQAAAFRVGVMVIGLDTAYSDAQLATLLTTTAPHALVVGTPAMTARIPVELLPKWVAAIVSDDAVPSLASVERTGAQNDPGVSFPSVAGTNAAVMAFSSGTTGQPKPAAYSHEQVLMAMDSMVPAFPDLDESSRLVCWLPLANLFQRMINLSAVVAGVPSYIVTDPRTVMDHVSQIEPDLLIGVPRFFERVHGAIQSRMAQQNPIVRRLTRWALAAGTRRAMASTIGVAPTWWDAARFGVADRVVLARLRAVFGTRMRYLVSGSAPMAPWLHDFYDAIGLPIYEAYGMSENVTPIAFNRPGARKRGTVGRPVASNEVRLAEDGEVLVRGPGLCGGDWAATDWRPGSGFQGYWPTGDLGSFDEEGYLRLTGRKADAFKTGLGRWVMPADVEAALRAIAQVDHVVVVGVGRPGVAAVVVLSAPISDAALISAIEQSSLALPVYQRPLGVIVTSRSFTIEDGELTTNLKLRRKAIEASFQGAIDRLYIAIQAARAQSSDRAAAAKIVLHREP